MKDSTTRAVAVLIVIALLLAGGGLAFSALSDSGDDVPSSGSTPTQPAQPTVEPMPDPGSSDPPTPELAPFYSQQLEWEDCRGGAQCSRLTVPVDYAAPGGATIELAVLRVSADDPSARVGSLVVNRDVQYGVRVVITPTYQWFSANRYGGVAYLNTFDRSEDLPAWVFSSNLVNGNAKSVAEAVSHEVGHTLGLSHDGITTPNGDGTSTTSGYYSGHGDWAPIMGVGYYRPVTQWSKGQYPGATKKQDDLAIIDTYISRLGSGAAPGSGVIGPVDSTSTYTLAVGGAIDRHSLQIAAGPTIVSVERSDPEGNLLARLRVRNASGAVVASANPSTPTSLNLEATLPAGTPAGTYTVEVESIGWTPSSDPGFTSYASMGEYVLSIDVPESSGDSGTTTTTTPPATPPPPPDSLLAQH